MCHSGIASEARIGNQQNVNHGVRSLRRFDGFFKLDLAAFVLRIRHYDDGLASCFAIQLISASEINGVVERRARGVTVPDGARIPAGISPTGGINASFINSALQ